MRRMFGRSRGDKPSTTSEQGWNSGNPEVMTTEGKQSQVRFPTSWTGRVQTPVKRVPAGKMWSQPEWSRPESWGGPNNA